MYYLGNWGKKMKTKQETLFDKQPPTKVEEPQRAMKTAKEKEEVEVEVEVEPNEDIVAGLKITEAEMGHELVAAFNRAPAKKKEKAEKLLQELLILSKREDAEVETFAKALMLERVLGAT